MSLENAIQRHLESYSHVIRTRAFFLWVEAGKPANRDWEFWLQAEDAVRERAKLAFDKTYLTQNQIASNLII